MKQGEGGSNKEGYEIEISEDESGRTVISCESSIEAYQAIWQLMTKGFVISVKDGSTKTWVNPHDVFIDKDGEFIFKPRQGKQSEGQEES